MFIPFVQFIFCCFFFSSRLLSLSFFLYFFLFPFRLLPFSSCFPFGFGNFSSLPSFCFFVGFLFLLFFLLRSLFVLLPSSYSCLFSLLSSISLFKNLPTFYCFFLSSTTSFFSPCFINSFLVLPFPPLPPLPLDLDFLLP